MDRYLRLCPRCSRRSAAHRFQKGCCYKCAKLLAGDKREDKPGSTARRLRQFGASLRARPSQAEAEIWNLLEGTGWRWNHPVYGYIPDFYHQAACLILEVDGSQHQRLANAAHDQQRDAFFRKIGIHTVRITASEALSDPLKHADRIMRIAQYRMDRR